MRYIGIKKFWRIEKKKPTKYKMKNGKYLKNKKGKRILSTRTTRTHTKKETNWREYNTSSPIMQDKLELFPDMYSRRIVRLCKSVSEMKLYEAYIQLDFYMSGRWSNIYNEMINLRVTVPKSK